MFRGNQRSMHQAPVIRVEEFSLVFERDVVKLSIYRNAGVVDPRIEATERFNCDVGDVLDLLAIAYVGNGIFCLSAKIANFIRQLAERTAGSRRQHQTRPSACGHARSDEANATRGTRDHDGLLG